MRGPGRAHQGERRRRELQDSIQHKMQAFSFSSSVSPTRRAHQGERRRRAPGGFGRHPLEIRVRRAERRQRRGLQVLGPRARPRCSPSHSPRGAGWRNAVLGGPEGRWWSPAHHSLEHIRLQARLRLSRVARRELCGRAQALSPRPRPCARNGSEPVPEAGSAARDVGLTSRHASHTTHTTAPRPRPCAGRGACVRSRRRGRALRCSGPPASRVDGGMVPGRLRVGCSRGLLPQPTGASERASLHSSSAARWR